MTDEIKVFIASVPEDAFEKLRKAAIRERPALIVIDTLIRFVDIKDINNYAEVSRALAPFLDLARETGSHILFIHHAGKGDRLGGDAILGSTALFGTVDSGLLYNRTDRYRTIKSFQRYGEDLPETVLELDPDTGLVRPVGTRQEIDEQTMGKEIIGELKGAEEPVREGTILKLVEGRKATKERALRKLVAEGKVLRSGKGVKGDPFIYAVSGFLPPSKSQEGGNKNPGNGVAPNSGSGDIPPKVDAPESPSDDPFLDSPSRDLFQVSPSRGPTNGAAHNGYDGDEVQTDSVAKCRLCGQRRFWRGHDGRILCGTCHPPAPSVVAEWLGS